MSTLTSHELDRPYLRILSSSTRSERHDLAVRIRLTRVGTTNNPIWRIVAADKRSPRDGRFLEVLGQYNPQADPSTIELDEERMHQWLRQGAQPTATVKRLLKAKGITA